jgi:NADPH:quinone reductase-like Zn-dependent oxidoreductase
LRARTVEEKGSLARELEANVWPLLTAGRVAPIIDRVFPLTEAADAHSRMESSSHIGKIVLRT